MSKPPLGSGPRFQHLEDQLSHQSGVSNPRALAAWIERRNYGDKKVNQLAHAGRLRAAKALGGK